MKRILLVIFISFLGLFFCNCLSFADETDVSFSDDAEWSEIQKFDREWQSNNKVVTDKEFEEVMKRYEKKKKYKKYEFEPNEQKDMLNDMSILNSLATQSKTIQVPADFRTYEGAIIPAGYYLATYKFIDGKHILTISQGRKIFARVVMEVSKENMTTDEIHILKIIHLDDDTVKIIYGDVDLNLEKVLYRVK